MVDSTHAEQPAMFTESALDVVEQDVRLKDATLPDSEAYILQLLPSLCKRARKAQLDFDFDLQAYTLRHRQLECQVQVDCTVWL